MWRREVRSLTLVLLVSFGLSLSPSLSPAGCEPAGLQVTTITNFARPHLTFVENQGQWDNQVLFQARVPGAIMWLTGEGIVYQFRRPTAASDNDRAYLTLTSLIVGGQDSPSVVGQGRLDYVSNYLIGDDPSQWQTDVPSYRAVVFKEVYAGIDLKYYGNGGQMEYDFILSPGADYSQIEIAYEGALSIVIDPTGDLKIETAWGWVGQQKPTVYQWSEGRKVRLEGEYVLHSGHTFGFRLGADYRPELALVIDPILTWSTFLGGNGDDVGLAIALDDSGYVYVAGRTGSTDFPIRNSYQSNQADGDVFVSKFNQAGDDLIYSTYLGGSLEDGAKGIAVDSSGQAFVAGYTHSVNFPTADPYQMHIGLQDGFIVKLNSAGSGLIYGTYLGGLSNDWINGIAIDRHGQAFVTGATGSDDFPTKIPFRPPGGGEDAFVTKLNPAGDDLMFSSYLGGGGVDGGAAIAVDMAGTTYVTGYTSSIDFPLTNAYQISQGYWDAFVTRINAAGTGLLFSTYLGGADIDEGTAIAIGPSGQAYVAGQTYSTDFPSVSAYQNTLTNGNGDAFITRFNTSGNDVLYSTYLGGTEAERAVGLAVDLSGQAYVAGYTASADFPTFDTIQSFGGARDLFLTRLAPSGNELRFSSCLGGSDVDEATALAINGQGTTYLTGQTASVDFPMVSAYQEVLTERAAFVTRITEEEGCCVYRVGDVNRSGDDEPNVADIANLVDHLFINQPVLICAAEADVNQSGGPHPRQGWGGDISIIDIAILVDYLFITGSVLGLHDCF